MGNSKVRVFTFELWVWGGCSKRYGVFAQKLGQSCDFTEALPPAKAEYFIIIFNWNSEFTVVSLPAEELGVRQHMLQSAVVGYAEG